MNPENYIEITKNKLWDAFQAYQQELSDKYKIQIKLTADYNILRIESDNDISNHIDAIENDIIEFAQKNLDEEYIKLPAPVYYSDNNKPVARICRDKNSVRMGDLIQFRNNADIWYKLAIITEIKNSEIYYVQHSPNCLEHRLSEDNAKEIRFICAKN